MLLKVNTLFKEWSEDYVEDDGIDNDGRHNFVLG